MEPVTNKTSEENGIWDGWWRMTGTPEIHNDLGEKDVEYPPHKLFKEGLTDTFHFFQERNIGAH